MNLPSQHAGKAAQAVQRVQSNGLSIGSPRSSPERAASARATPAPLGGGTASTHTLPAAALGAESRHNPWSSVRMRHFVSALLVAAICGCASSNVREVQGPDGTRLKTVKCSADSHKCLEQAALSCPEAGTYRVLASESHAGGLLADLMPGPVTWYGMTYVCGQPDGKLPDFKFGGQQYIPPAVVVQPVTPAPRPTTTTCTALGGGMVTCTSN